MHWRCGVAWRGVLLLEHAVACQLEVCGLVWRFEVVWSDGCRWSTGEVCASGGSDHNNWPVLRWVADTGFIGNSDHELKQLAWIYRNVLFLQPVRLPPHYSFVPFATSRTTKRNYFSVFHFGNKSSFYVEESCRWLPDVWKCYQPAGRSQWCANNSKCTAFSEKGRGQMFQNLLYIYVMQTQHLKWYTSTFSLCWRC